MELSEIKSPEDVYQFIDDNILYWFNNNENYVKLWKFDKNRIICYNTKHNLRVYLGLPNLSDKGQLK